MIFLFYPGLNSFLQSILGGKVDVHGTSGPFQVAWFLTQKRKPKVFQPIAD
jgi:hypothetical protein